MRCVHHKGAIDLHVIKCTKTHSKHTAADCWSRLPSFPLIDRAAALNGGVARLLSSGKVRAVTYVLVNPLFVQTHIHVLTMVCLCVCL